MSSAMRKRTFGSRSKRRCRNESISACKSEQVTVVTEFAPNGVVVGNTVASGVTDFSALVSTAQVNALLVIECLPARSLRRLQATEQIQNQENDKD